MNDQTNGDGVGPVLQACPLSEAVISAIRELNSNVQVIDRGSYFRVLVPNQCILTREAIENHTGSPFHFPCDLESVMSSFRGRISVSEDRAVWTTVTERVLK